MGLKMVVVVLQWRVALVLLSGGDRLEGITVQKDNIFTSLN